MTRNGNRGVALLAEVLSVLSAHGGLHCAPAVEEDGGLVTLTVTFHPVDTGEALEGLEVLNELTYLSGLANVRAFCDDYGIDARKLEALLPSVRTDTAVHLYESYTGSEPLALKTKCGRLTIAVDAISNNVRGATCSECLRQNTIENN